MKLNITIIGSGNVASHLGPAFKKAGHKIVQVFSPSKNPIKDLNSISDIYILAIKDDAIEKFSKKLRLKKGILVHTSGTVAADILKKSAPSTGVLYPLQTFSKGRKPDLKNITFCIETTDKKTRTALSTLVKSIGGQVQEVNAKQRLILHLAAVFANNFSNQMYAAASEILKKEKLDFSILKPLISETAEKIMSLSPKEAQTGPAARGDKETMKMHLKMLSKDKDLRNIYKLISKRINKK